MFFGFGSCPNSSGGLFSCEWRVRLRLSSQRIFPSSKEDCFPSPCISVSAVVDAFCLQTQPPTLRLLETCHSRAVAIRNAEEILNDILEAVFSGSASEREQFESASADSLPDNKGLSEGNMADPAVTPQKHPVLAGRVFAAFFLSFFACSNLNPSQGKAELCRCALCLVRQTGNWRFSLRNEILSTH